MATDATFNTPLFDDALFDQVPTVSKSGPYYGRITLHDYRCRITPNELPAVSPVTVP